MGTLSKTKIVTDIEISGLAPLKHITGCYHNVQPSVTSTSFCVGIQKTRSETKSFFLQFLVLFLLG